ncbi:unnamed protein product, partial [Meganyctiphanes norvegica]
NNENGIKPEGGSHFHKVLQNTTYGNFVVNVNEDIEGSEEPGQIEDDEIQFKEELEIKEEPIDFTSGNDQCSQYDQDFPHTNTPLKNQIIYTEKNHAKSAIVTSLSQQIVIL